VADSVSYEGPRGELRMRDRHVDQRVYLAEASDLEFDVIAQLSRPRAGARPASRGDME
jgi:urea transport system substrate-binding protein